MTAPPVAPDRTSAPVVPAGTAVRGAGESARRALPDSGAARPPSRLRAELLQVAEPYVRAAQPVLAASRAVLACVSGLGWAVLSGTLGTWAVAWLAGWREFALLASILLALFGLACLFTVGRTRLDVLLEVDPVRVRVGESSAAHVRVTNVAGMPLLPVHLTFPVGHTAARFTLPALGGGASFDEVVVIPTRRRGVVVVGPVTTQRGDPFGIVRRELTWAEPIELFVHPVTVPLEPVGSGLLRDLEGHTTNDTSMSDLAFHALREYTPGDDRRYIHWRSSAKLSSAKGIDSFMVKQFLDTRRSHIAVVVDVDPASYASEAEFELAVSAGASVALRALADEMDLSIVCGSRSAVQPPPHLALDTFSRAEPGDLDLPHAAGRMMQLSPDASVVVLVTGRHTVVDALLAARSFLPVATHAIAVTCVRGAARALQQTSGLTVVTIGQLSDLPVVLTGGSVQ